MNVSLDEVEERQEEIEESLEELLIFPTHNGLRRSADMIQSYFEYETIAMKQYSVGDMRYRSIKEGQEKILGIISEEQKSTIKNESVACKTA
ncbi:hypothetical protein HJC23_004637 [Cyclotella cryptica]|uniref:DNA-directed RNA polymerase n=1 Tax=Cyclotella cryptica TaxID=29204 RepID=A0ABD3QEL4_9STRA|eukprot:CCRYP_005961-RA/>CCRYP_005961-RA protein AED:0.37 eAED:0.37 QI:0/-1/0/1/-1/1/1/0/91